VQFGDAIPDRVYEEAPAGQDLIVAAGSVQ
jgi:hypothetical protein